MSKARYLKVLYELRAILEDHPKALQSIETLESYVAELRLPERASVTAEGPFPLPNEIKKGSYALFSDGACRGNPGPGAWGMMGQDSSGKLLFTASGVEVPTTNNRMEMIGAISALEMLSSEEHFTYTDSVYLYSDSKYLVDGAKSWIHGWKKRGWKKADKSAPENLDLWQQIDLLMTKFQKLHFYWVKGHAGHPQNEYCDQLANQALDEAGL